MYQEEHSAKRGGADEEEARDAHSLRSHRFENAVEILTYSALLLVFAVPILVTVPCESGYWKFEK